MPISSVAGFGRVVLAVLVFQATYWYSSPQNLAVEHLRAHHSEPQSLNPRVRPADAIREMSVQAWANFPAQILSGQGYLIRQAIPWATTNMTNLNHIEVSESADVSVIRLKDEKIIDPQTIQELGQELFDLVEKDNRKKLILSFSSVEFLSSAALGKLITFEKKSKQQAAELILTDISPEIFQVFAITNLNKLFQIKDSEADALAVL